MTDFDGKVAVITGAASGIGLGLARQSAREGMKVVVADITPDKLRAAEEDLKALGAEVLAVTTDVSKAGDVEALLQLTLDRFGAVHLLCNNAGVISVQDLILPLWEIPQPEWQRLVDVNLWGVIHGIRFFTPVMLQQDTECYMVNTASTSPFDISEGFGIYKVTKSAVISLSETLHQQLTARQAKLRVSVLCPGFVSTPIVETEASRYRNSVKPSHSEALNGDEQQAYRELLQAASDGMSPSQVAEIVFQALRQKALYIFTYADFENDVRAHFENILQHHNEVPGYAG